MWGEGCPLRPWQPLWRRRSCRGILYGALPATIRNKPPLGSWHCRNIEEEEEETLCIDSPLCPGP